MRKNASARCTDVIFDWQVVKPKSPGCCVLCNLKAIRFVALCEQDPLFFKVALRPGTGISVSNVRETKRHLYAPKDQGAC